MVTLNSDGGRLAYLPLGTLTQGARALKSCGMRDRTDGTCLIKPFGANKWAYGTRWELLGSSSSEESVDPTAPMMAH